MKKINVTHCKFTRKSPEKLKLFTYENFTSKIQKMKFTQIGFCLCFNLGFALYDYYIGGGYKVFQPKLKPVENTEVPLINIIASYIKLVLVIMLLPTCVVNYLGHMCFDSFHSEVKLRVHPSKAPFICFRFATRGHYFELVQNNVNVLKSICMKLGMRRFIIQVATETELPLTEDRFVKQTVIPKDYVTKSGALFKARVLQYCLEDGVNFLNDNDWIVHMDEETRASENSIKGLLNFVCDGRYHLGQGMIIYLKERMLDNIVCLMDGWRIADDLGKQRFQLNVLHRLIMEWKGSFSVALAGVERKISFDHGAESSITEDGYFGFMATKLGYKFKYVEGEMYEMSPTTVWDMIQQRKRWFQGGFVIAHSPEIPLRIKIIFVIAMYGIIFSFSGVLPIVLNYLFPVPYPTVGDLLCSFYGYFMCYFMNFGIIKSFFYFSRRNYLELLICLIINVVLLVPNVIISNIGAFLAFTTKKKEFYIIKKD